MKGQLQGLSYRKRVADINYIYPVYAISERQLYNILNASADPRNVIPEQMELFLKFEEDDETERLKD